MAPTRSTKNKRVSPHRDPLEEPHGNTRSLSLIDLLGLGGHPEVYLYERSLIRDLCKKYLNFDKTWDAQKDSEAWQKLKKTAVKWYPKFGKYQNMWPVKFVAQQYLINRKKGKIKKREKQARFRTREASEPGKDNMDDVEDTRPVLPELTPVDNHEETPAQYPDERMDVTLGTPSDAATIIEAASFGLCDPDSSSPPSAWTLDPRGIDLLPMQSTDLDLSLTQPGFFNQDGELLGPALNDCQYFDIQLDTADVPLPTIASIYWNQTLNPVSRLKLSEMATIYHACLSSFGDICRYLDVLIHALLRALQPHQEYLLEVFPVPLPGSRPGLECSCCDWFFGITSSNTALVTLYKVIQTTSSLSGAPPPPHEITSSLFSWFNTIIDDCKARLLVIEIFQELIQHPMIPPDVRLRIIEQYFRMCKSETLPCHRVYYVQCIEPILSTFEATPGVAGFQLLAELLKEGGSLILSPR